MDVIAGSSPSLTCTVELSPAVDVPVTVNTMWSGPDVIFMPASSVPAVMVNTTTYTSTVTVDAAKNGSYTCQATVISGGTMSGSTDIIVGMYLLIFALLHLMIHTNTVWQVKIGWVLIFIIFVVDISVTKILSVKNNAHAIYVNECAQSVMVEGVAKNHGSKVARSCVIRCLFIIITIVWLTAPSCRSSVCTIFANILRNKRRARLCCSSATIPANSRITSYVHCWHSTVHL